MEKLKMISGSEKRAEEVKKVLEIWGAKDVRLYAFDGDNFYYFVIKDETRLILKNDPLLKYIDYEIVELPEPEPQTKHAYKFQPFQKVLVRYNSYDNWKINIYSNEDAKFGHNCILGAWEFCIPYEGNEHLLGTTKSPKGGEE